VLLCCSALNVQLGLPTFICGAVTSAFVLAFNRQSPLPIIKGVSWGVLPLVAGLFVLVEALDHTGVIAALNGQLHAAVANSITAAAWSAGLIVALASNLMNNLPVGLIVGSVAANQMPLQVVGAMLIGVDLGPNLSVTGSLARRTVEYSNCSVGSIAGCDIAALGATTSSAKAGGKNANVDAAPVRSFLLSIILYTRNRRRDVGINNTTHLWRLHAGQRRALRLSTRPTSCQSSLRHGARA
jgi:hypothetical protein